MVSCLFKLLPCLLFTLLISSFSSECEWQMLHLYLSSNNVICHQRKFDKLLCLAYSEELIIISYNTFHRLRDQYIKAANIFQKKSKVLSSPFFNFS